MYYILLDAIYFCSPILFWTSQAMPFAISLKKKPENEIAN